MTQHQETMCHEGVAVRPLLEPGPLEVVTQRELARRAQGLAVAEGHGPLRGPGQTELRAFFALLYGDATDQMAERAHPADVWTVAVIAKVMGAREHAR